MRGDRRSFHQTVALDDAEDDDLPRGSAGASARSGSARRRCALGIDTAWLRGIVIASATLITAAAVAISGVIGRVGLLVPHIACLIAGTRFDRLLPVAILLGGSFTFAAYIVARSAARIEIPLGVLTALIGGPAFVWLLVKRRPY